MELEKIQLMVQPTFQSDKYDSFDEVFYPEVDVVFDVCGKLDEGALEHDLCNTVDLLTKALECVLWRCAVNQYPYLEFIHIQTNVLGYKGKKEVQITRKPQLRYESGDVALDVLFEEILKEYRVKLTSTLKEVAVALIKSSISH